MEGYRDCTVKYIDWTHDLYEYRPGYEWEYTEFLASK